MGSSMEGRERVRRRRAGRPMMQGQIGPCWGTEHQKWVNAAAVRGKGNHHSMAQTKSTKNGGEKQRQEEIKFGSAGELLKGRGRGRARTMADRYTDHLMRCQLIRAGRAPSSFDQTSREWTGRPTERNRYRGTRRYSSLVDRHGLVQTNSQATCRLQRPWAFLSSPTYRPSLLRMAGQSTTRDGERV